MFYYGDANDKKFGEAVCKKVASLMKMKYKGGKKDLNKYEINAPTMPSIIKSESIIQKTFLTVFISHLLFLYTVVAAFAGV